MKLQGFGILILLLLLSILAGLDGARRGRKCKAAVYKIRKPTDGRMLVCCRFKRIKFECNPGYKLVDGDQFLRCRKGKILGKFPKCALATTVSGGCGKSSYNHIPGRIVGGRRSTVGKWPWMAALYRDGKFICGGSLITPTHVLTAAHCFRSIFQTFHNPERYGVWLGKTELNSPQHGKKQYHKVKKIYIHEKFQLYNFANDIAIIQLSSPATFNKYVRTLCLPKSDVIQPRQKMYAMGWGSTKRHSGLRRPDRYSSVLNHVMLPMVREEICRKSLPSSAYYNSTIMLCAGDGRGKRDACYGDSGGPLVYLAKETVKGKVDYSWHIVGIVSWGDGCAKKNNYGFFTRVSSYGDWIKSIIASTK